MSQPGQSAPERPGQRKSQRLANQRSAPASEPSKQQRGRAKVSEPFLEDAPMDDSPPCTLARFKKPRIRRCPHDLEATTFVGRLNSNVPTRARPFVWRDGGLDGYNWKVRFDDDDDSEFVLKLFWDTSAPDFVSYHAVQRECENVALLEMMRAALSEEEAAKGPILVRPRPNTREEAEANLFAFSDARRKRSAKQETGELKQLTKMPRMRRCFGWMQFTGAELLQRLPDELYPSDIQINEEITRVFEKDATYTALVYEFVPRGENEHPIVQEVLDFLWCVGFSFCPITKAANWESSVLLDYSDIIQLNGRGWTLERFRNNTAEDILWG